MIFVSSVASFIQTQNVPSSIDELNIFIYFSKLENEKLETMISIACEAVSENNASQISFATEVASTPKYL